jgi:hypothetical protein
MKEAMQGTTIAMSAQTAGQAFKPSAGPRLEPAVAAAACRDPGASAAAWLMAVPGRVLWRWARAATSFAAGFCGATETFQGAWV